MEKRDEDNDESEDHSDHAPTYSFSMHLGHVALAIGIANVVLLIAFVKPGANFCVGTLMLGLVAAYGAWRTARDFDWSPFVRAVMAALAAVPLPGMAVCLGLLLKGVRGRG